VGREEFELGDLKNISYTFSGAIGVGLPLIHVEVDLLRNFCGETISRG
jgi:hypothetical protein